MVIDFTTVEKGEVTRQGTVELDATGKYYIEFEARFDYTPAIIPVIFATCRLRNEKYTLITCTHSRTEKNIHRYQINEIYQGVHLDYADIPDFTSITLELESLAEWVGQQLKNSTHRWFVTGSASEVNAELYARYTTGFGLNYPEEGSYNKKFQITDKLSLRITERCYWDESQEVTRLRDDCHFTIESVEPVSRIRLYHLAMSFRKLLSLFMTKPPRIESLQFTLTSGEKVVGLHYQQSPQSFQEDPDMRMRRLFDSSSARLRLIDMQQSFGTILSRHYTLQDDYITMIDLLNASETGLPSEISFLQLTKLLELFHRTFLENMSQELFPQHYVDAGLPQREKGKGPRWILVHRILHLLLYASESIPSFATNTNLFKEFSDGIKTSRNYYTHYSKPFGKYHGPKQLPLANNQLQQLARAVILKHLGLPGPLIQRLLSHNFGNILYPYDKNPYSLTYRPQQ